MIKLAELGSHKKITKISTKELAKKLDFSQQTASRHLIEIEHNKWIKRQITPQQAKQIKSLNIKGFKLKKEYKRFYPNKNLVSHILGFCNIDGRGVEGIEKSMDMHLIPDFSKQNYNLNENEPEGFNVVLTIDSNIQAISEIIIKQILAILSVRITCFSPKPSSKSI